MKKHPGIFFMLWAMATTFLLSFELAMLGLPEWLYKDLMILWGGECSIWIIHFHGKWLEALDRKYYNKEKRREKTNNSHSSSNNSNSASRGRVS